MVGLGTIVNVAAIIAGCICGVLFGKALSKRLCEGLTVSMGVCVMFLGAAGALAGMLSLVEGSLTSGRSLMIIISMGFGTLFGELIDIDKQVVRFGEWLKQRTGNAEDAGFVQAFVTTSITVCVGAMAVVGSIQDGMYADHATLFAKALLDFVVVLCLSCGLGKGCGFSALPVALFQGSITGLAVLIKPFMTEAALGNLSLVGSILIFCVGINLAMDKKIRVANMLPAILIAPALAFLPFSL